VDQVAVPGVNFQDLESGLVGPPSRGPKIRDDLFDAGCVQFLRGRVSFPKRQRTGSHYFPPAAFGFRHVMIPVPGGTLAGLPPGVGQLDARTGPLAADKSRNAGQPSNVLVFPQA